MIAVAGPRIDPRSLPSHPGLEVRGYVDRLYRHLAVCDLAIVQGGLTTTMELTAAKRPFLYFPLAHHFEQNFHVRAPARPVRRRRAHGLRDHRSGTPRRGDRQPHRSPGQVPRRRDRRLATCRLDDRRPDLALTSVTTISGAIRCGFRD